jgi:hypothetical protein
MTLISRNLENLIDSRRAIFVLAVLASTAWTPVASAKEFPKIIPLSSLDGTNGFRLDGASGSVAGAGDVNGDGFADVILGTHDGPTSYVVFGKTKFAATLDLSSLNGTNGFRIPGFVDVLNEVSVGGAGDVNGDGFDDVIVGTPFHGTSYSGLSYVIFGKASGFAASIDVFSLDGRNGFRIDDSAIDENSGYSVAGAGDVNGDGFADVIIGTGYFAGSSYVVFGKTKFAATINLSSLNGSNGFRLDGDVDTRRSVAGADDVNGDGFADVIVGESGLGSSYVVFGKALDFAAVIDLSSLDGGNGFRLDSVGADNYAGYAVGGAGDVNGDGFADVIVGGGESYIVFGKALGFAANIDLSTLNGSNGFQVAVSCICGASGAGDVNGDGFADVVIGDFDPDYVIFGRASGFTPEFDVSSVNGKNGFQLAGGALRPVAGAGDVNGDGFADVIVAGAGSSSYVVFGRAPDSARTRIGAAANQYISGGAFDDVLKGRDGEDALEGRGGADALVGGVDPDAASYLHAAAGVKASLANPAINTGDAAEDSYVSIENLTGSSFDDKLIGDDQDNRITGDAGSDVLIGREGKDNFVFNFTRDSPPGSSRDRIIDFDAGTATTSLDKIDVRAIDAKTGPGNQRFTFIGKAAFSNTAGELRVEMAGTSAIIQGDVDGDGNADLAIELQNFTDLSTLTEIDFEL